MKRGGRASGVFWTAFIGLLFDYYDLYLFVYLEHTLKEAFELTSGQSAFAQFVGLASVGAGALGFGFLADRFGRSRMLLIVFGFYLAGILGLSLSWSFGSLLGFRVMASLALGAEWGISHSLLAEGTRGARRYRYSAYLQFSILGGLLAAGAVRYGLDFLGWRWLFAISLFPVLILSLLRFRLLANHPEERREPPGELLKAAGGEFPRFVLCFSLATLSIASGTVNIFVARDLPQSFWYTFFFWFNVAPGMLAGAWLVRRIGVRRSLLAYAMGLAGLSFAALAGSWPGRLHVFALGLPLLNGIPFGLMGAWFNEMFRRYPTMLSGAAYNLGRILAGFSPILVVGLGLHIGERYFIFSAGVGAAIYLIARFLSRELPDGPPRPSGAEARSPNDE